MPSEFKRLTIPEVILITPKAFEDDRGFFMETYKQSEFVSGGIPERFVQDNHSHSVGPVLRGLHFQTHPHAQGKLVGVARGEIFDVAVDLRKGSPTYKHWVAEVLSDNNHRRLYVPVGFAHGFCVLGDEAVVTYKVTAEYAPDCDAGIVWNDPALNIDWPLKSPLLSAKDAKLPLLCDVDNSFVSEVECMKT